MFVLIMAITIGMTGKYESNAITTQEFATKEKCEYAKKEFLKLESGVKDFSAVCVPK